MNSKQNYVIDVIPGDGIGPEVMPPAMRCVELLASAVGFGVTWRVREWGSEHYQRTGTMMPVDGLDELRDGDAILFGSVGDPAIADDITLWGLLIPIRRTFDQYVNLRPVRTLPGVPSRLVGSPDVDLVIVRENVEGEYSRIGGRFTQGESTLFATQEAVFSRNGITRVARYAVEQARQRSGSLISATKSNAIIHTMRFWDEVVAEVVAESDVNIDLRSVLIDALAADLVLHPERIDVIVASNLFGDILSDLAAALTGSIGLAASANLNPERRYPSLFEPVHGSAPDIAGLGLANPIGQIWSAALMLEHLEQHDAAAMALAAIEDTLRSGVRTRDLGGTASTAEFCTALFGQLDIALGQYGR